MFVFCFLSFLFLLLSFHLLLLSLSLIFMSTLKMSLLLNHRPVTLSSHSLSRFLLSPLLPSQELVRSPCGSESCTHKLSRNIKVLRLDGLLHSKIDWHNEVSPRKRATECRMNHYRVNIVQFHFILLILPLSLAFSLSSQSGVSSYSLFYSLSLILQSRLLRLPLPPPPRTPYASSSLHSAFFFSFPLHRSSTLMIEFISLFLHFFLRYEYTKLQRHKKKWWV